MDQVIYGDVLFVINFAMDFLALYLTGTILRLRRRTWLTVLAASIGALYAVVSLFADGHPLLSAAVSVGVSFVMCYTAYGGRMLPASTAVFIGVSFMLGGSITALYGFMNRSRHVLIDGEISTLYSDIPPDVLIMLAFISAVLSIIIGRFRGKRHCTAEITVTVGGRMSRFEALSDSGNLLREPISGLPVVVASPAIMRELIPEELFDSFAGCRFDDVAVRNIQLARKMRMIPASSVTDTALLPGLKCDSLTVDGIEREGVIACGKLDGRQAVVPETIVNE